MPPNTTFDEARKFGLFAMKRSSTAGATELIDLAKVNVRAAI